MMNQTPVHSTNQWLILVWWTSSRQSTRKHDSWCDTRSSCRLDCSHWDMDVFRWAGCCRTRYCPHWFSYFACMHGKSADTHLGGKVAIIHRESFNLLTVNLRRFCKFEHLSVKLQSPTAPSQITCIYPQPEALFNAFCEDLSDLFEQLLQAGQRQAARVAAYKVLAWSHARLLVNCAETAFCGYYLCVRESRTGYSVHSVHSSHQRPN